VQSAVDCLVHLLADGCDAELTIAGEFRWENGERQVREYLREKNLEFRVRTLPPFTQEEAPAIYQAAHVLIHPKYKDPCPTVPIEAMACGIPVIGSRSGGMPELVTPDCGVLVEVEDDWDNDIAPDARKLAEAAKTIFNAHSTFSMAARTRARAAFDKRQWLDAHAEIFNEVLQS
jgi:glycosyltransferase involved in cell wall biosynthesis